jgi:proton-dependent oligopeptide transporter, POT family
LRWSGIGRARGILAQPAAAVTGSRPGTRIGRSAAGGRLLPGREKAPARALLRQDNALRSLSSHIGVAAPPITERLPMTATTSSAERMPPGIPFIVANEFAERFCYYGINSILSIYMVHHLHFPESQATIWQSLFKFGAYFFPIFGAILSDVFWGKFRTIMTLAMFYCAGCAVVALGHGPLYLGLGLFLMAFGTGGIKPCVSTNVGDQFTTRNQHLISKAFSYFYFSINLGSSISIYYCEVWLDTYGPTVAFGIPALAMLLATAVFWLGRKRFVVVQPAMSRGRNLGAIVFALGFMPVLGITMLVYFGAGRIESIADYRIIFAVGVLLAQLALLIFLCLKSPLRKVLPAEFIAWLDQSFTGDSLWLVLKLACVYYVFVAIFWSLWEQSNGQTWTLQATSDLMDKHLFGFLQGVPLLGALAGYEMLPAQIQVVNGLFILIMIPLFTFGVYPLWQRFFKITALRKICVGLFVIASSYLIIAWIEDRIMHGHSVSVWWQILAYGVLSASEVLISITGLEFAYSQAPLKMKSFMMAAMYLFSVSFGQVLTIAVNQNMVAPLQATAVETGAQTWVGLREVTKLQPGQKIDLTGDTGLQMAGDDGKPAPLDGTFLISQIDAEHKRVLLMDVIHRQPFASSGQFSAGTGKVSTYRLVGPMYFLFFAAAAAVAGFVFIFVTGLYREKIHVREAAADAAA